MLNINLKGKNGIYETFKLIDAFKSENNITFVLVYKEETEQNLLKIYISKFENGKLYGISEEEWTIAKRCMSAIVSKTIKYECVKLPSFLELEGALKPCLIATISYFIEHYKQIEKDITPLQDELVNSKFRFTGGSEWNALKNASEKRETQDSVASIVNRTNELVNQTNNTEIKNEPKVIESTDYKSQKENFMNLISRGFDDILESKNKEIVELTTLVEGLERDLRRVEIEKKQAINMINMYHDKIRRLNDTIKDSRE